MDVASRLSQWKESSPDQRLIAANRYLPPIAVALLVIVLAWRLAQLTWLVVPGPPADSPAPEIAVGAAVNPAARPAGSFDALAGTQLFGAAPEEAPPELAAPKILDAPETTLNLTLNGVQSRSDSEAGEAIISSVRNEQKTYFVGDTIENSNGAVLQAVYSDRVLLNRAGRLEALSLPRESPNRPRVAARPAPPPALSMRGDTSLREVIGNNASRITEVIRLSPHIEQGQMVGFRINPGRDRETFAALGLEPGDVVTDVNGLVVDDPQGGLQVLEALGETSVANISILRNGSPQTIVIDTTQLQHLAENLQ